MLTKAVYRFGTNVHNAEMHQHDCRQACSQWNRQAASIISESEGAYRKNCDTRTDSESVAEGYIILAASIWQQWPATHPQSSQKAGPMSWQQVRHMRH